MGYPDRVPCRTDSGDLERFRNPSNPMFAITAGKELRPVKAAAETHSWSALTAVRTQAGRRSGHGARPSPLRSSSVVWDAARRLCHRGWWYRPRSEGAMVRELAERREQSALEFIAKSSRVASALRAFRLLAIVASFAVFAAAQIEELTAYEQ